MAFRFLRNYFDDLRTAIAVRREHATPRSAKLVASLIAFVLAYLAAAVVVIPPGEAPAFNFIDERGAVTVLSAIFLAMGSSFAIVAFFILSSVADRHRLFWLLIAMAVGYLAFDELLQIHERLGSLLDRFEITKTIIEQSPMRCWNDVIVILYGVIALPAAICFSPSILRFPRVFEYLGLACFFYVVHTAIDSMVEPPTTLSVMLEESAKLLCSTFLAIALLVGLLGIIEKKLRAA